MNADATWEQVVVIVGAGLAGGNAAVTLREEGWRGRIVLLGAESGIPFGRPPLSKTYLRGRKTSVPGTSRPPTGMAITTLSCAPGPPCGRWIQPSSSCDSQVEPRWTTTSWCSALAEETGALRCPERAYRASISCAR